ncbi:MAG: ImmA/IrrE family metallo-endopeptidase [Campylobacteraceae bacterium]|jgi:Zn-dependent peptidase ImmA (M78 family)|nr:ImmA/IrrE family metallo-endopeptidase [Campylobacteraceae bacterium]
MAMSEALINKHILQWAIDRAGIGTDDLSKKYAKIEEWVNGDKKPTFNQAQDLAKILQIPFGYLYLKNPPEEKLPIPDLRTFVNTRHQISPTFITLLNDISRKQAWYKEYAIMNEHLKIDCIGKFNIDDDFKQVAQDIANKINFSTISRNRNNILKDSIERVEDIGILVMKNSVLGSNTHKKLDMNEFRGFAMYDEYAPLIFINAGDSKNAQLFTLFHELTHLWINESGISGSSLNNIENMHKTELFCNKVAAEILMPEDDFKTEFSSGTNIDETINNLENHFCVSKFAIINKIYNLGLIEKNIYDELYSKAKNDYINFMNNNANEKQNGGGNPYFTMRTRVGKRFSNAVFYSTMEGVTLHRDAGYLLDINPAKIYKYANELGIH